MTDTTNPPQSTKTLTIHISPELEALIRQKAERVGRSIDDLAKHALEVEFTLAGNEEPAPEPTALEREVRWLLSRSPDEVTATNERLLKSAPPVRPLPPGKTLEDVVAGLWPGDESDERVIEALRELS